MFIYRKGDVTLNRYLDFVGICYYINYGRLLDYESYYFPFFIWFSLDFSFYDIKKQKWRHVDSKGQYGSESRLRHKLLRLTHGIDIEIWTKDSWGV